MADIVSDSLDTCVILSLMEHYPEKQFQAAWELMSNTGWRHLISDLAITEAVYVMEWHHDLDRQKIVLLLQNFFSQFDEVLDYNRKLFNLVLPYYLDNPSLSFNDCVMAFYAELNGAEPLFTFDKDLAKRHPSAKRLFPQSS